MGCGFVRPTDQECFHQCIWDSIVPEVAIKQIGQLCRNPTVHIGEKGWWHFR